jgi:excisionase family DNA binding protein
MSDPTPGCPECRWVLPGASCPACGVVWEVYDDSPVRRLLPRSLSRHEPSGGLSLLDDFIGAGRATLSVDEVASVLDMSASAVRRAIKKTEIPHLRISGKVRIPTMALHEMLVSPVGVGGRPHDGAVLLPQIQGDR